MSHWQEERGSRPTIDTTMSSPLEAHRPAHPSRAPSLEVLSREDCLALLATSDVGRLGVSIRALPAILPVNFAMLGNDVVIRSVSGSKLDAAVAQQIVAFEVDDHDPDGMWGWSVLVVGAGSEITDPDSLAIARALGLRSWAFTNDRADRYLRVETTVVTGRRFGPR